MAPIAPLSTIARMAAQLTNSTGTNGAHHCGRSVAASAAVSANATVSASSPASSSASTTSTLTVPVIPYVIVGIVSLLLLIIGFFVLGPYSRRRRATDQQSAAERQTEPHAARPGSSGSDVQRSLPSPQRPVDSVCSLGIYGNAFVNIPLQELSPFYPHPGHSNRISDSSSNGTLSSSASVTAAVGDNGNSLNPMPSSQTSDQPRLNSIAKGSPPRASTFWPVADQLQRQQ